jgi:NADH-quinone oxidoreductase subunit K
MLSGILFCLSVAGIFINRKNLILLLMCIELMLLSVNFNFVAFSYFMGAAEPARQLAGQIFVFFILTVAAAEAAIGLAILVVLFRNRRSVNVDSLDSLKG